MLQDNTLIFCEDDSDVSASSILDIDGSALGRAFVFCTLPAGTTAMSVTLKTADAKTNSTTLTSPAEETHAASATDLARGYMFFPMPVNAYKFAQVACDVTGSPAKNFVCGITDAPNNIEVFFKA
jgi:predicted metalloprotease with PDZ domain